MKCIIYYYSDTGILTLEYYDGNKSRAAAALGINRKTLSLNE